MTISSISNDSLFERIETESYSNWTDPIDTSLGPALANEWTQSHTFHIEKIESSLHLPPEKSLINREPSVHFSREELVAFQNAQLIAAGVDPETGLSTDKKSVHVLGEGNSSECPIHAVVRGEEKNENNAVLQGLSSLEIDKEQVSSLYSLGLVNKL